MRGKVVRAIPDILRKRITPAYAGKRTPQNPKNPVRRDHPRLCGEKFSPSSFSICRLGSPPPMRGKGAHISATPEHGRITPAYAGKREYHRSQVHRWRDHPRLCGEKGLIEILENGELGSPPPMRGKDVTGKEVVDGYGITPAYAGKSGFGLFPNLCN